MFGRTKKDDTAVRLKPDTTTEQPPATSGALTPEHVVWAYRLLLDREPESDAVRQLAESLGQVWCAAIGQVEVTAVFHRKLREGAFDAAACREVMAQFQDDCRQGIWTWIPLTATVLGRAAAAFTRLPRSVFLRSADAIHVPSGEGSPLMRRTVAFFVICSRAPTPLAGARQNSTSPDSSESTSSDLSSPRKLASR